MANVFLAEREGEGFTQQVALKLNRLNSERQNAEKEIITEIEERHRQQPESFTDTFLVLAGEGWHRGVVGIVASRMSLVAVILTTPLAKIQSGSSLRQASIRQFQGPVRVIRSSNSNCSLS